MIKTDYRNLMGFLTIKELNQKQVRWAEILAEYYFKIKHIKGTDNTRVNTVARILRWSMPSHGASLIWVRGNTQGTTFLATRRSQRETIHQQHRIVHIIVIYVFCTLLKHTNKYT